jgi:hypothetical protein
MKNPAPPEEITYVAQRIHQKVFNGAPDRWTTAQRCADEAIKALQNFVASTVPGEVKQCSTSIRGFDAGADSPSKASQEPVE